MPPLFYYILLRLETVNPSDLTKEKKSVPINQT